MFIGNRYADNKLYRGIGHTDGLPLTAGDLHEYADILYAKNALLLNNLIGSGVLNKPKLSVSTQGVSLVSPSVLLIDGDIALVHTSNGNNLLRVSDIQSTGISEGFLCIVGWYQSLNENSTLRAYGGVDNAILENDIKDKDLGFQVSTRYQLRWDTVLLSKSDLVSEGNVTFELPIREESGEIKGGNYSITSELVSGNIRVARKPAAMDYALSDLYVVPIIQYNYQDSRFTELKPAESLRLRGSAGEIISSNTEPTENLESGVVWYNPDTQKFQFYLEGIGFVATASDMTLAQYHNTVTITEETSISGPVYLPIGIPFYTAGDVLQVVYDGVVLTENLHYTISGDYSTVTLLDFTTEIGDQVTFIAIKILDTNNLNTVARDFEAHVNTIGGISRGHVSLSDVLSPSLTQSSGVAATPKLVYDSTTLIDRSTNKKYRLKVDNGVLGIEEIL